MARLFISLCLAVFLGIFIINKGSEYIWQQWGPSSPDELNHAKQVAKILQSVHPDFSVLPSSVVLLNGEDVAWLPEQKKALVNGDIITTFTENGSAYLTFSLHNQTQLVRLGPFKSAPSMTAQLYLFKFISFSLLALLLVIWLRPLWLDLVQLNKATSELAQGKLDITFRHSKFSAIANLTNQFHLMANKVANLMNDQKQLVNAVSHDLRTPLARLKFALVMLDEKEVKQAQAMSHDVQEMERLIDEMLSYARLEIAADNLNYQQVDFSQLLVDQLTKLATFSNKQLTTNIDKNVYVYGEPHYLARIVQNLLINAYKYGHSKLQITLNEKGQEVVFQVGDDGVGIKESDREKVFAPFVRVDDSRNKDSGGFGLGLAIVKKIISWHQGRCEIGTSSLGGALFTVYLPNKR